MRRLKTAIVLGGGGARGAYEAGVISYLREELEPLLGRELKLDVITGTSVGAIHACFLAATSDQPATQGRRLTQPWLSTQLDRVLEFGVADIWRLIRESVGRPSSRLDVRQGGLANPDGLRKLVTTTIPWLNIGRNLRQGHYESLAVSATHVGSGRTIAFVQKRGGQLPPWGNDPYYRAEAARISPKYALASAAIPILFPAVWLDGQLYVDGGLRFNVPLSPALRLGAERVIVVSLRPDQSPSARADVAERARVLDQARIAPTAPFLFGKTLNALLLDRTNQDYSQLKRINDLLEAGTRAYGREFSRVINGALSPHRNQSVRYVRPLRVCPSRDLGTLAVEYTGSPKFRRWRDGLGLARRTVLKVVEQEGLQGADLASYLLFDGGFAEILIDLGRRDARALQDEWIRFWDEEPSCAAEAAQREE